jgi:hypothetical protein
MKIPNCNRCLLYAHSSYLVCAVHPGGVTTETCPDFRPDPKAEDEELWTPEGYSWYGDRLISNRRSRLTQEEQLQIIDTHPLFTGVCPECGHEIDKPGINWHCPACGSEG